MTMKPIAGLLYQGHPCSYDDGIAVEPPVEPPITEPPTGGAPAPGAGPNSVKYDTVKTGSDENFWLGKMQAQYKQDLKTLPGSQQLYFDILTNAYGKRYSDAVPSPAGYVKDDKMKLHINTLINDASYNGQHFDVASYSGRLEPIYAQLVVDKKAGLIGPPL